MSALEKQLKAIQAEEARIKEKKNSIRRDAIQTANELIATFALKPEELAFKRRVPAQAEEAPAEKPKVKKAAPKPKKAIKPKYRLPTGETWTGRGIKPRAFTAALEAGHSIEEFLIEKPVAEEQPAAAEPAPEVPAAE